MAGIGFILRKLAAQDNFSGIIRAYVHSAVVAVGPWIMIVICIGLISYLTHLYVGSNALEDFLSVILWNFLFSFAFTSPLYMVSARYVADCLFDRNFKPIPGILITNLVLLFGCLLVPTTLFYTFYATMDRLMIFLSIVNFSLLSMIWTMMLYLECIRNFQAITFSWILGMAISIYLAVVLGRTMGANGMLLGINLGLVILVYTLAAQVLAEYRYGYAIPQYFKKYCKKYAQLMWGGFFLFAGMWVDKLIMWYAPESILHNNGLRTFPAYDGGMFISYMSIIPVLALFVFSLETNFYVSYIRYIKRIENNDPLNLIDEEKRNIWAEMINNGRSFLVLQGSITFIVLLIAPNIFDWVGLDFSQLGIFRLGALGAFFAALNLFIFIFLTYFDAQDYFLRATIFMFFSNIVLTFICEYLGFTYYGLGYCLAMIATFMFSAYLLTHFIEKLNYHIFITNIVKHQDVTRPVE